MDIIIKLTLPFPPTVNDYYKSTIGKTKDGRLYARPYLTKRVREYRVEVKKILDELNIPMFTDFISMDIIMVPPDNRPRDTDNILKGLFDALEGGGFVENDYLIKKHSVDRVDKCKPGCVELTIEEL